MKISKQNYFTKLLFYVLLLMMPFMSVLASHFKGNIVSIFRDTIIIVLILFFFSSLMRQKTILLSKADLLLLFFIIYGFLHSIITTVDMFTSFSKFRLVFFYPILALLIVVYYKNVKAVEVDIKFFLKIFTAQGVIMIIFSVLEVIYREQILIILYKENFNNIHRDLLGQSGIRLVSLMYNPINLGIFLNIFLIFLLYDIAANKQMQGLYQAMRLLLITLTAIVILLTYSRIAYIIMFSIFIGYISLNWNKLFKFRNIFLILSLLIVIGLSGQLILYNNGQNLQKRFSSMTIYNFRQNSRITNWKEYLHSSYSSGGLTYLWGSGLGTSNSNANYQTDKIKRVENSYITFLGEVGILGLLTFIIILARLIKNIYEINKYDKKIARVTFQILLVFLLGALTNDVFHNNPFSFYFWFLYCYLEIKTLIYTSCNV